MTSIMLSARERRMIRKIGRANNIDQLGPILRLCLAKVHEQLERAEKRKGR